ncbi:MAG TPA: YciI family protein [Candidatus Binataceae bacterium]
MQYMLLIYESEADAKKRSDAENQEVFQGFMQFSEDLSKSGKMQSGDALQPSSTATSVRVRNGKTMVTDGPFAETKEQLGGYYTVEAKDLDEAIAIAARIPSVRFGCIEVRPVMKFN